MKIALVCPYDMFHHVGGVQEFVMNLAKGLRDRRHEVKIITPRPRGFKGPAPDGYIFLGSSRRISGALSTDVDLGVEVDGDEIDKVLGEENFDVINFHEPMVPVLGRQIVTRSKKAAHVGTRHALLPDSLAAKSVVNLLTPYGRTVAEKMHLLTATGTAAALIYHQKGSGSSKILVQLIKDLRYIPCAVDLKTYHPVKKKPEPLSGPGTRTIVYIGRPDKRKGVDWLLLAFAEAQESHPELHLMIAGEGNRMSDLKQTVKQEKISNVHFLGYVSDERKIELLANADLACFPSLYGEGFGIVLLEAMAMGLPFLAGNNLGYRGVMKGFGRIGLVDPEATTDFANRINVMLEDESLRAQFRKWELNEVRQYDYPKIIDQYEDAYRVAYEKWLEQQHLNNGDVKNGRKFWSTKNRFSLRRQSR